MNIRPDDPVDSPPHGCELMTICLGDPRVPVRYKPQFREYMIWVSDLVGDQFAMSQDLLYCPWCGQVLPTSLREQLFEEIEELSVEEPDDYFAALRAAPEKYQTAAWWQGRYDWDGNAI